MVSAVAGIAVWLSRIWLFPCSRQLVPQHKRGGIGAIVGLGSLSIIFPILQRERAEPSITASLVYCVGSCFRSKRREFQTTWGILISTSLSFREWSSLLNVWLGNDDYHIRVPWDHGGQLAGNICLTTMLEFAEACHLYFQCQLWVRLNEKYIRQSRSQCSGV